ncbi:polysaccharide biosynthesis/export family protein [Flagellimonas sp. GZD32]|uniref:polysaccharide biosynthesis/export family protein n=1 Tax=Flagellimonas cixiensis TaxID=3228750 RepID=UPI0035C88D46
MKIFNHSIALKICSLLSVVLILNSCASKEDILYLNDVPNFETIVADNTFSPKFKVDDEISIFVSTFNKEASEPFNLIKGASEGGLRPEHVNYLIDENGEIDFPVIGKIKLVGLTAEEVRVLLRDKLKDYLVDPIINIRLENFTITVLGEVNRPGTYPVIGEKVNIFEALGLAGDMRIKGVRKNVLVIRDFEGTKVHYRMDLTKKDVMESPAYYLTQNDVVYVEPNKSAVTSSSLDNRASIIVSILSVLITSSVVLLTRS